MSDGALLVHIKAIHTETHGAYGWPRTWGELLARGIRVGEERVQKLMQLHSIWAKGKRRFRVTTDSSHDLPIAPNLLDRQLAVAELDSVWAGDITYIHTSEGWRLLAVVIDLYSRQMVGWSLRGDMTRDIVIDALRMAWFKRRPSRISGLMFHSDRGSQGVFNRSSQHWIVGWILSIRSRLQLVSSNPAFSGACCLARKLRLGSLGRSTATGQYSWGSIAAEGRFCSRSCRTAMDWGSSEEDPYPRLTREPGMVGWLLATVPGQGSP